MSLKDWLQRGLLTEHETSLYEIRELFALADRDLEDCELPGLSADRRLSIAYNAALQIAKAALAAKGYRVGREAHHYWIIQSLAYTVEYDSKLVEKLDAFRKKRNISDYERTGAVSDIEADEMIKLAKMIKEDIKSWLRKHYPRLLN